MKAIFRPQKQLFHKLVDIKQSHSRDLTDTDDASSKLKINSQSYTENNAHLPCAREHLFVKPALKVCTRTALRTLIYANTSKIPRLSLPMEKKKVSHADELNTMIYAVQNPQLNYL